MVVLQRGRTIAYFVFEASDVVKQLGTAGEAVRFAHTGKSSRDVSGRVLAERPMIGQRRRIGVGGARRLAREDEEH